MKLIKIKMKKFKWYQNLGIFDVAHFTKEPVFIVELNLDEYEMLKKKGIK